MDNLRSAIYDILIPNTKYMYEKVLTELPEGSRVLEVGIGNGNCLAYNANLIRRKKFTIVGIDIDQEYLSTCQKRINECGLTSNVTCRYQDLLTMKGGSSECHKFDFVLFMESFPVIPISVMEKMVRKSKTLLKKKGKIVFVHNLVESKNPLIEYAKPLIVDYTSVDFGRLTSHAEMISFLERCRIKKFKIEKIYDAYVSEVFPFIPPLFDHRMEQFAISGI